MEGKTKEVKDEENVKMAKTRAKGPKMTKGRLCSVETLKLEKMGAQEAMHARASMCARRTNAPSVDLAITDSRSAPGSRILPQSQGQTQAYGLGMLCLMKKMRQMKISLLLPLLLLVYCDRHLPQFCWKIDGDYLIVEHKTPRRKTYEIDTSQFPEITLSGEMVMHVHIGDKEFEQRCPDFQLQSCISLPMPWTGVSMYKLQHSGQRALLTCSTFGALCSLVDTGATNFLLDTASERINGRHTKEAFEETRSEASTRISKGDQRSVGFQSDGTKYFGAPT
eukprot:3407295-Amphidinium_carterae.4